MAQSRSSATMCSSNWNKLPQSVRDHFPISSDQLSKHLENSLFVIEDTELVRQRFKWRYTYFGHVLDYSIHPLLNSQGKIEHKAKSSSYLKNCWQISKTQI